MLSMAIAVTFMPGLGLFAADKAKANEDWYISRTPGERSEQGIYQDQSLKKNENTAELKVIGTYKKSDGSAYTASMKYVWKKYDTNLYEYVTVATTTTPSYTVTGIDQSQEWECEVTDPDGDANSVYFYIYKGKGWTEDALMYYYVNKGESPVLKAKIDLDEGQTEAGLGIKYEWYKAKDPKKYYDDDDYDTEWEVVSGNTDSLAIPAVNEDCVYKCFIKDAKDNKESIIFNVRIAPTLAPLFKVAYAIQSLKDPKDMTLNDKTAVDAVKASYDALTEKQKNLFEKRFDSYKNKLEHAVDKVNRLNEEAGKTKAQAALAKANYKLAVKNAKATTVKGFKVKAKKGKKAKATWNKVKNAAGYQIVYSMKKNFKKSKKLRINNGKKRVAVLKKLKAKKTYFAKIRPIIKVKKPNGKFAKVYGKWSAAKKFKAKKK